MQLLVTKTSIESEGTMRMMWVIEDSVVGDALERTMAAAVLMLVQNPNASKSGGVRLRHEPSVYIVRGFALPQNSSMMFIIGETG